MQVGLRYVPCPGCGYDLRAMVGERCPECGVKITGGREYSVIPWVQREYRSRVVAYLQTVWLVLFRPGRMAQELRVPARVKDARSFYWVSVMVATGLGTALGEVAILLQPQGSYFLGTIFVCMDRWYEIAPLAITVYGAVRACLWIFRRIVTLGGGSGGTRFARRRIEALSMYGAALAMMESGLVALLILSLRLMQMRDGDLPQALIAAAKYLALVVVAALGIVYLSASLGLVLRAGRMRAGRAFLTLFIFPPAALITIVVFFMWVHWIAGFIVLAIQSMMGK